MKTLTHTISLFFLALLLTLAPAEPAKACDRSDIQLDSLTYDGISYNIYMTIRIGAGINGFDLGAIDNTRTFAFNVFGSPGIVALDYTSSLTSDSTGATYMGTNFGPYLGSSFAIGFIDSGTDFACITDAATCGDVHSESKQVFIKTNIVPDSIRLLGIESAGNPVGGCYPNLDMVLDLTAMPVVWASFEATGSEEGINLEWTTSQESNNDYFTVMRSVDGQNYEALENLPALGNSNKMTSYSFVDHNPVPGVNYYKIAQVDLDGTMSFSSVQSASFTAPKGLSFQSVSPIPARDYLNVNFAAEEAQAMNLSLIDLQGRTVLAKQINVLTGLNSTQLDLNQLSAGLYTLNIAGPQGSIQKKIVKK